MSSILQIPCQKIITGGQTGVDRAALDVCLEKDFPSGGWCPKNRRAEDGVIPLKYPLKETQEESYEYRTFKNAMNSDGTIIISTENLSGGTLLTQKICRENNKPLQILFPELFSVYYLLIEAIAFIQKNNIVVLNVAGPRASEWQNGYYYSKKIVAGILT